jgi:hypothetical protein
MNDEKIEGLLEMENETCEGYDLRLLCRSEGLERNARTSLYASWFAMFAGGFGICSGQKPLMQQSVQNALKRRCDRIDMEMRYG